MSAADEIKEAIAIHHAACATGPWRTDVENAPENGFLLGLFTHYDGEYYVEQLEWLDGEWRNPDFIAFTTIKPPKVTP